MNDETRHFDDERLLAFALGSEDDPELEAAAAPTTPSCSERVTAMRADVGRRRRRSRPRRPRAARRLRRPERPALGRAARVRHGAGAGYAAPAPGVAARPRPRRGDRPRPRRRRRRRAAARRHSAATRRPRSATDEKAAESSDREGGALAGRASTGAEGSDGVAGAVARPRTPVSTRRPTRRSSSPGAVRRPPTASASRSSASCKARQAEFVSLRRLGWTGRQGCRADRARRPVPAAARRDRRALRATPAPAPSARRRRGAMVIDYDVPGGAGAGTATPGRHGPRHGDAAVAARRRSRAGLLPRLRRRGSRPRDDRRRLCVRSRSARG